MLQGVLDVRPPELGVAMSIDGEQFVDGAEKGLSRAQLALQGLHGGWRGVGGHQFFLLAAC